jgi:hypothetical protein
MPSFYESLILKKTIVDYGIETKTKKKNKKKTRKRMSPTDFEAWSAAERHNKLANREKHLV